MTGPDRQPTLFDPIEGSSAPRPADEADRELIRTDLGATLFVEAGAGSGKTSALVGRVLALVDAGVPMRSIAAITFTERAAAELRHRVRAVLEERATSDPRARWTAALADLDGAAVTTLHAFAQRLLGEHPVEAGLPPDVEVLDEINSLIEFDERWGAALDRIHADPAMARTLELARALAITDDHLRAVALEFTANWDLIDALPPGSATEPPTVDPAAVIEAIHALGAFRECCLDDSDAMAGKVDAFVHLAHRLERADDEASVIELLRDKRVPTTKPGVGARARWADDSLAELRERLPALEVAIDALIDPVSEACLQRLVREVAAFVSDDARRRRVEGRLRFHDLLVHARRLLADPDHGPTVRSTLSNRYQRLLLDEFQDTDPLQIEIATLLAADPRDPAAPWSTMATRPGRLFFVGDPKQSIYRFRRADIALYLAVQDLHAGADPVELNRNFRSSDPVVGWVNHTFARLIRAESGSQPPYRPLDAVRASPPVGPGLVMTDGDHPGSSAAELRAAEAADVAAMVTRALDEGWSVQDPSDDPASAPWRPARPGDICILLPARTSLPQLEAALTSAAVPYRVETSSLVYASEDVRALMSCLRSLADSTDQLSLVTALRSPAFGCGDDDLFTWSEVHGGVWDFRVGAPPGVEPDHPVAEAMAWLRSVSGDLRWLTPPQVIDRLVGDRRLLESAAFASRPTDRWRHLRFVADQARAWSDAGGGDLGDYLAWARLQASDTARVAEPVLDEPDADSVRIMTVHASKGLEFNITILSGLTTRESSARRGPSVIFPPGGSVQVKLHARAATTDFDRFQPIDEQMDRHEKLRLLYVACTRARDHLVVPCHRSAGSSSSAANLLWEAGSDGPGLIEPGVDPLDLPGPDGIDRPGTTREPGVTDPTPTVTLAGHPRPRDDPGTAETVRTRAEFDRGRAALIARVARPSTLSATAVAQLVQTPPPEPRTHPGLLKDPVDVDLPPWHRGRDGATLGRAVHAVLQDADLVDGTDIEALASVAAAAEGIPSLADEVASRARSALGSPSVREAISGEHWREIYVAAPVGDRLVEGYIDLLYRRPDGFVVLDYKTDAIADVEPAGRTSAVDSAARRERAAAYRMQLATYAHAVRAATRTDVVRCVLCFLDSNGAHEIDIEDLGEAIVEVGRVADLDG